MSAASILIGFVGMMGEFFPISVGAFYLGMLLLVLDFSFEKFNALVKTVVITILCAGIVLFSWKVVFYQNPVNVFATMLPYGLNGVTGPRTLAVYVWNNSSTDYRDLDFIVRTIPRDPNMLKNSYQATKLEGVTIFQEPPFVMDGKEGDRFANLGRVRDDGSGIDMIGYIANFKRIRCALLPHDASLQINIEISNDRSEKEEFIPDSLTFKGEFKGKFSKPIKLDQKVLVQSFGGPTNQPGK